MWWPPSVRGFVLVSWGSNTRLWLEQQIPPSFGGWKLRSRCLNGPVPVTVFSLACRQLPSFCVLTWSMSVRVCVHGRMCAKRVLLCYKIRTTLCDCIYSTTLEALSPNTVTLGVKASQWILGDTLQPVTGFTLWSCRSSSGFHQDESVARGASQNGYLGDLSWEFLFNSSLGTQNLYFSKVSWDDSDCIRDYLIISAFHC